MGSNDVSQLLTALKSLDSCIGKTISGLGNGAAPKENKDINDIALTDKEPKKIFVRVVFLKLGEIDTIAERYAGDAFLQCRWREPALDGRDKDSETELDNWASYWNPKTYIENSIGELKEDVWYMVIHDKKGEAWICQRRRIKGKFYEKMELPQFPVDTQDLTITITTTRGEWEIDFFEDLEQPSIVNIQSFTDVQTWRLHNYTSSWTKSTTNAYANKKHKHPALSVSCKATRRFQFYLWNIYLVMVFISSLIYSTFCVSTVKVENRLQLSFILLLSNITFKFSSTQVLPKVPYLTYLDKYILIMMGLQCLVCAWHAVVAQLLTFFGEDTATLADRIALGIFLFTAIFFNIFFLVFCLVTIRKANMNYTIELHSDDEDDENATTKKIGGLPDDNKVSPA